mmetsp:Transcript_27365/g.40074  ORF Transcript_27365/g.40074 Transcript_27365/m.40074 type:complete len:237 (+) Transcript_27365:76-786(+)
MISCRNKLILWVVLVWFTELALCWKPSTAPNVELDRRSLMTGLISLATASVALPALAEQTEKESMFAPKFVQEYEDFEESKNGWRYRDVNKGNGGAPGAKLGDRVVLDWSGYTIGYFGRPFEAKGGPQGGAFDKDIDYYRTVLGSGSVVKGLEEALVGMKAGQVRQVVVPYESNLSYPADDSSHDRVGPKPTTFSGQRALNFVLDNPRVDRTLLFNVKVIRVDAPDGKGGFIRGIS